VLRSDAGFANAETVEALLQNPKLQAQIRGQVLWIDEAGLLGARTLARVAALAEAEGCRIILSGDTAQHRAVERGDALRMLEKHAQLQAVELKTIRRQKADEHKAVVADLRAGNLASAFKRLDKLGMIQESQAADRHRTLAVDYTKALIQGKTALVISPTHAEGERVTREIRQELKRRGKLGEGERIFARLKSVQWTEAERGDSRSYQSGMVVQFHQNVPGFQRGERVTVKEQVENGTVSVTRQDGQVALLPVEYAARFQVYETKEIALAPGDMVRITQNGFTNGRHRLNNGDLKQVKGFTREGDIVLTNGWVIPQAYAHWSHGYCVTSYASQSKSVDCVFITEGSESFRAADREQFYVSASRFKEALTIYTDDKRELFDAVTKSSERPSAMDLAAKHSGEQANAPVDTAPSEAEVLVQRRKIFPPTRQYSTKPRIVERPSRGIRV
jgi:ATP-dependent exoDNAse (exonuclease V) alpha subunit